MNADEREDLAWRLGAAEPAGTDGEPLSDDRLLAYRRGELPADDRDAVEGALARDAEARRRLVRLAGVARPAGPAPRVRERVLRGFAARDDLGRWWMPAAAAAALVAAVLLVPLLSRDRPAPLPSGLSFQVAATGLAEERGAPTAAALVRAEPETTVRIVARANGALDAPMELAVYRRSAERLERVARAPVDPDRGAGELAAPAADLVGRIPGSFELFVVLARSGDLPASLAIAGGDDPALALAGDGRRLVHRRELRLLAEPPPAPDAEPETLP